MTSTSKRKRRTVLYQEFPDTVKGLPALVRDCMADRFDLLISTPGIVEITWKKSRIITTITLLRLLAAEAESLDKSFEPQGDSSSSLTDVSYDRKIMVEVLIYHYRDDIKGCGCGWAKLGASWPEHVAEMYELAARTS